MIVLNSASGQKVTPLGMEGIERAMAMTAAGMMRLYRLIILSMRGDMVAVELVGQIISA